MTGPCTPTPTPTPTPNCTARYIKREAWENMNGQGRGFGSGVRDDKHGPMSG